MSPARSALWLAAAGACAAVVSVATAQEGMTMNASGAELPALPLPTERGTPRVYRGDELNTIGMPCGGICAGQLYVLGDGRLGCWQIDGTLHFTGVGHHCYRSDRPARPIEQGFALAVTDEEGNARTATLDRDGYDAIEFVGEYPRAIIRYRADAQPVPPVNVDLEVFSPFIPLDARHSAWPATVLTFTVSNPTDRELKVALGGWLENTVFSSLEHPATLLRVNHRIRDRALTTLHMVSTERTLRRRPGAPQRRVLADFESGTYEGWSASGSAFGEQPATGTHPNQQPVSGFGGEHLVNSYTHGDEPTGKLVSAPFEIDLPFLAFRIGGGGHEGQTCLNLVIGDRVVRSATGRNQEQLEQRLWMLTDYFGQTARLEIVDSHSGGWGHINVDDIMLLDRPPEGYTEYDQSALDYGSMAFSLVGAGNATPLWEGRKAFIDGLDRPARVRSGLVERDFDEDLVGVIRRDFKLAPGASEAVTFIISWHFPNLHTDHGRMYASWFTDAAHVARKLHEQLDTLRRKTRLFCDTYYRETTLPWWLSTRLMMPVSNLATGTAQWWRDGRFWAWEGVGCCPGTCTHVWNYAQAHAWLFPELARSTRIMQDLGAGFDEETGLVGFRSDRNFAADGQAGTILKCYREHLTSDDDTFLRMHWPKIRPALEYLVRHDANADGIIENDQQHNTYDINFVGANTFVGSLYLAALQAGAEMARLMGDNEAAERYHALYERGRAWTMEHLYNGSYFVQQLPDGETPAWQYGQGCLSDQVFGQTWAHLLGLGHIYPPDAVRSALRSVFEHNWTRDVGPHNTRFEPERWFARPGEPGLFLCTWPRGGRPEQPVRYRDEVWTGIEYQVAAGMIWEGMLEPGLTIVRGIDLRYDPAKHNPWNEVECGDHYARALASWSVLHALAGMTFDGPAGELSFAPRISPDDFASFFCSGTGWGTLVQQRGPYNQVNAVVVRYGTVDVQRLALESPDGRLIRSIQLTLTGAAGQTPPYRELEAALKQDGPRCVLTLASPLRIEADQRLNVELKW